MSETPSLPKIIFGTALGCACIVPLTCALTEPYRIVVRKYDVSLENLNPQAAGLRVAQISDLHRSAITPKWLIDKAVQLCNAQAPDIVLLTGDFVSRRNSYLPLSLARIWAKPVMHYAADIAESLGSLRAPHGVFAVPGNHDHANGNLPAISALLAAQGVQMLVNQNVRVRGLPLIGLDDLRSGRPDVVRAFEGIGRDEAQLAMSHNPRTIALLADRNCVIVAGHTHNGQVHLPLSSFRRTPKDMEGTPLDGGWFSEGRARLYVSAGLGSVHFPMRFRCPPEIVVYTLRSA